MNDKNNLNRLTIAVSKGRILEEALPLLAQAGIKPLDDPDTSRLLRFPTTRDDVDLLIIRAADVPTYVEYGAADCGIAGKDVLVEHGGDTLYEPLDLQIATCRLALAGKPGQGDLTGRRLRIATKYVNATRDFFAERGEQVEIIKLYGSMELAPLVGLADLIVDLVDTGNTLKANGLTTLEDIMTISSRLVVNRAAMKMKREALGEFIETMNKAVQSASAN